MPSRGILIALLLLALLTACAATPRSTRLRHGDPTAMTEEMAASLARSEFLAQRGPDSPPAIVTINKVVNLTSDLIPPAEQWMLMARVQGSMPILALREHKNVTFQIPPERYAMIEQAGLEIEPQPAVPPTHVMTAEFRSARREMRDPGVQSMVTRMTDFYYLQYEIRDLDTRELVWTDQFEFQREAVGLRID